MSAPLLLLLVAALVVMLPALTAFAFDAKELVRRGLLVAAVAAGLFAPSLPFALIALACATLFHMFGLKTRTGQAWLGLSGLVYLLTALANLSAEAVFIASICALCLRTGVLPLHSGIAAIAERHPSRIVEITAVSVAAVYVHLNLVIAAAPQFAHQEALLLVELFATATFLAALMALSQKHLRGLGSTSVTMHAGMLLAAVAAAGRGHFVAALFVAITSALALGGFFLALRALEHRAGEVLVVGHAGRAKAFPALAFMFLFFAAASIALPGTIGFIADDLLLHALWDETPLACGAVITSSALLAIAFLKGFSAVFFGPAAHPSVAPDLVIRERLTFAGLLVVLIIFGIQPMLLITALAKVFNQ